MHISFSFPESYLHIQATSGIYVQQLLMPMLFLSVLKIGNISRMHSLYNLFPMLEWALRR